MLPGLTVWLSTRLLIGVCGPGSKSSEDLRKCVCMWGQEGIQVCRINFSGVLPEYSAL